MADAKLTIKCTADVKKAAEQLKALGYNIEDVKKSTDKANNSASIWQQTLKKGSEDNIKSIINLGAKYLTAATIVTGVYKGIKACVQEALKENKEAQEKVDKINLAFTEIKANLGNALLDSITPALETIYEWLEKISGWTKSASSAVKYNSMLSDAKELYKSGGKYDVSGMTYDELIYATNHLPDNVAWTRGEAWIVALGNALTEALASYPRGGASGSIASITQEPELYTAIISRMEGIAEYSNWLPDIASKLNTAQVELENAKAALAGASDTEKPFFEDAVEMIEEYIAALKNAQQAQIELLSNCMTVADGIMNVWDSATDLKMSLLDKEIEKVEDSEASEEEKAVKLDNLKRRQFEAEKRNSIANAAISVAEAIVKAYTTYMATPWLMWTMIGLTSAAGALQIGTIASQQYTGLADGGIVQSPTRALIGEGAEKEAVLPLSKLDKFVNREVGSGTIVINVTVNGSGNGAAEDVYYAIERAQRTGLLPRWRYA